MTSPITLVERAMPGMTVTVRAALVTGARHRVVVDTLMCPADMEPFVAAQPTLILYTHCDWDHCWGTRAFPGVPVIGHRITRERLLGQTEAANFTQMSAQHPEFFTGSAIVPPDITFEHRLSIDAGGLTLELHHMPGHTHDTVLTHIPELETLLAGDWAESPILSLNEPGFIRAWAGQLRHWERSGIKRVVPAHGEPGGPELLARNAAYLEELIGQVELGHSRGRSVEELQALLPVERFLPDVEQHPAYYRNVHPKNVDAVVAELSKR